MARNRMTVPPGKDQDTKPTPKMVVAADIDISDLVLQGKGLKRQIAEEITGATLTRTIYGASTLEIDVYDPDRSLLRSPLITKRVKCKVNHLRFELAQIRKIEDILTLVFEDEGVGALRTKKGFKKALRKNITRAQFVHRLVNEIDWLTFYSPEEKVKQKIEKRDEPGDEETKLTKSGWPEGFYPPVKNFEKATRTVRNNLGLMLQTCDNLGAGYDLEVIAYMVVIEESEGKNLRYGHLDSIGMFQQRTGWGGLTSDQRMDIPSATTAFLTEASKVWNGYLGSFREKPPYAWVASHTQRNFDLYNDGKASYARWEEEAKEAIKVWRGIVDPSDLPVHIRPKAGDKLPDVVTYKYEFTRGDEDNPDENSWDAMQRLADEVNWRCFMVGRQVNFVRDEVLMRHRAMHNLWEFQDPSIGIDFDWDTGKKIATATMTLLAERWWAPPGSIVRLNGMGPANGRWIVANITRNLFTRDVDIELIKPEPQLLEPAPERVTTPGGYVLPDDGSQGGLSPPWTGGPFDMTADPPLTSTGRVRPVEGGTLGGGPNVPGSTHYASDWQSANARDIMVPAGSQCFAVESGTLIRLGGSNAIRHVGNKTIFGLKLTIQTDSGPDFFYTHMGAYAPGIREGMRVTKGQVVGQISDVFQPSHLHFAVEPPYTPDAWIN